jgi:4-carboxymuconolactone decarboxylase
MAYETGIRQWNPKENSMSDSYTNGLQVRRQVMGDDFVDRAFSSASEFSRPLQDFITANAWGSVWCRSGVDQESI